MDLPNEIDEIVPRGAKPLPSGFTGVPSVPPLLPTSSPAMLASVPAASEIPTAVPASKPPRKGVLGGLAAIGAVLAKFWSVILALLLKFKFLLIGAKFLMTGATLLISILVYSFAFGWPIAAGFVGTIFVHECGHAWAARRLGHKVGWMVFIPFMGGLVFTGRSRNAVEDAFVGIMGPVFGTVMTLVWLGLFFATHNLIFLVLAMIGFFLNLINLAPTAPLDGGWIVPVFSPKILVFGIPFLLIFWRNPGAWLLGFLSIPRVLAGWKAKPDAAFFQVTRRQRALFAVSYIGLASLLAAGYAFSASTLHRQPDYIKHVRMRRTHHR